MAASDKTPLSRMPLNPKMRVLATPRELLSRAPGGTESLTRFHYLLSALSLEHSYITRKQHVLLMENDRLRRLLRESGHTFAANADTWHFDVPGESAPAQLESDLMRPRTPGKTPGRSYSAEVGDVHFQTKVLYEDVAKIAGSAELQTGEEEVSIASGSSNSKTNFASSARISQNRTISNLTDFRSTDPKTWLKSAFALKVLIVSAKGLRNADMVGKSDPYCVCQIHGSSPAIAFQTPVVSNSLNPVWNHTGTLEGFRDGDSVSFQVFDSDSKKDELLGRAMLTSSSFQENGFFGDLMLAEAGKGIIAYLRVKVLMVNAYDVDGDHATDFRNMRMSQSWDDSDSFPSSVLAMRSCSNDGHRQLAKKISMARRTHVRNKSHENSTPQSRFMARKVRCHARLVNLVSSRVFDNATALLTLVGGLAVGMEVQHAAATGSQETPLAFNIIQILLCFAFSAELALRMLADGQNFAVSEHRWWNLFDFIIVASAIGELILTEQGITDSPLLLFTRVVRIVRVVRVVAVVPALKELKQMIWAIFLTFTSLCYAMLLILMVMYIFGILLTEASNQHRFKLRDGEKPEYVQSLVDNYGTVPRTVYTLFKCFTGGVSWGDPAADLFHLPWIFPGIFITFITFCTFAFMNIITGFFCNNALDMASKDKSLIIQQQLRDKELYMSKFQDVFSGLDTDRSGDITLDELEENIGNPSVREYFSHLNLEVSSAWDIFRLLDKDQSGCVNVEEFILGCLQLRGEAKTFDIARLAFNLQRAKEDLQRSIEKIPVLLKESISNSGVRTEPRKNEEYTSSTPARLPRKSQNGNGQA